MSKKKHKASVFVVPEFKSLALFKAWLLRQKPPPSAKVIQQALESLPE